MGSSGLHDPIQPQRPKAGLLPPHRGGSENWDGRSKWTKGAGGRVSPGSRALDEDDAACGSGLQSTLSCKQDGVPKSHGKGRSTQVGDPGAGEGGHRFWSLCALAHVTRQKVTPSLAVGFTFRKIPSAGHGSCCSPSPWSPEMELYEKRDPKYVEGQVPGSQDPLGGRHYDTHCKPRRNGPAALGESPMGNTAPSRP